ALMTRSVGPCRVVEALGLKAMTSSTLRISGILALAIIAGILRVHESRVYAVEDTDPPELTSFEISPATVDTSAGSQTITFTAHIVDSPSGNGNGPTQLQFRSPSGNQYLNAIFYSEQLVSGTPQDGIYSYTATLPAFSEQGTWRLYSFLLGDSAKNNKWLSEADLVALGLPTTFENVPFLDEDGDGLDEDDDMCPERAEDTDGFEDTDGCPEPDNDGDTILDAADNCPNHHNPDQANADDDGLGNSCDPDDDNDDVLDIADGCPVAPEDHDGYSDGDGCPDPGDQTKPVVMVQLIDQATSQQYVAGHPTRGPVAIRFVCFDDPESSGVLPEIVRNQTGPSSDGNTFPSDLIIARTQKVNLEPGWHCVDAAGNIADPPAGFPVSVVIDRRPPTCSVALSRTSVPRNGTPTRVTVTVGGTDPYGISSRRVVSVVDAPEAGGATLPAESPATFTLKGAIGKTFRFVARVTDLAGNTRGCAATVRLTR
ncbi:MAG: thrombospondin type 3 repeat-containing protein, partial [Dehalococcoidia bacterium]